MYNVWYFCSLVIFNSSAFLCEWFGSQHPPLLSCRKKNAPTYDNSHNLRWMSVSRYGINTFSVKVFSLCSKYFLLEISFCSIHPFFGDIINDSIRQKKWRLEHQKTIAYPQITLFMWHWYTLVRFLLSYFAYRSDKMHIWCAVNRISFGFAFGAKRATIQNVTFHIKIVF